MSFRANDPPRAGRFANDVAIDRCRHVASAGCIDVQWAIEIECSARVDCGHSIGIDNSHADTRHQAVSALGAGDAGCAHRFVACRQQAQVAVANDRCIGLYGGLSISGQLVACDRCASGPSSQSSCLCQRFGVGYEVWATIG